MYQLILNLMVLFDALWSGIASFAAVVTSFRNKIGEIDETAAKRQSSRTMYNLIKKKKKREMADKALVIRGKIMSFAAAAGDIILLGQLKQVSFTKLFHRKDANSISYAEIVYTAVTAMTPAQRTANDISDPEIAGLRDSIDTFKNLPSPQQMKVAREQETTLLNQLFREADLLLENSLDVLMYQFKDSDFFTQYINARPLLISHRHTTIEGVATDKDSGADLGDVKVLITSGNETFEEVTNVQGLYKRQISPETEYTVKFILPEYEALEFEKIKLSRGEHERLNVRLKKSNA